MREKQIGEMARVLCDASEKEYIEREAICKNCCYTEHFCCSKLKCPVQTTPSTDVIPRAWVEGWDVELAREIFEEIDKYVIRGTTVCGENLTLFNSKTYAELKKKYTEGKNEN